MRAQLVGGRPCLVLIGHCGGHPSATAATGLLWRRGFLAHGLAARRPWLYLLASIGDLGASGDLEEDGAWWSSTVTACILVGGDSVDLGRRAVVLSGTNRTRARGAEPVAPTKDELAGLLDHRRDDHGRRQRIPDGGW